MPGRAVCLRSRIPCRLPRFVGLVCGSVEGVDVEAGNATVAERHGVELLARDDGRDNVVGPAQALLDHLQHALGIDARLLRTTTAVAGTRSAS